MPTCAKAVFPVQYIDMECLVCLLCTVSSRDDGVFAIWLVQLLMGGVLTSFTTMCHHRERVTLGQKTWL